MPFLHWQARRTKALPPQAWARTTPTARPQRRYLDETEYPLPKDEAERRRLDFQHHALYLTLGNHYLAPLPSQVRSILDVGTGTGIWPTEMARQFPGSLVLGLDVDPALYPLVLPDNCLLRIGNILTGLPLPDAMMDYVHQRFLVLAIPDAQWPDVVHELVRVTRPGGWIEMVETDARVQQGGPATTQMFRWIDQVRAARGLHGEAVKHLGALLQDKRVRDVEIQEIPLRVGAWGDRVGLMMESDIQAAVAAFKEPCCATGVDPREFDACLQMMATEWGQTQASVTIQVVYGRR